jgi:soluble P-type ATPase
MLHIEIPGRETLELRHLVCDFNGTLACDGVFLDDVPERLAQLGQSLDLHILTAGTHGGLDIAKERLVAAFQAAGVAATPHWQPIATGTDKAAYVVQLGAKQVIAVGNGANDALMLQQATLSIAILGLEGLARAAADAAMIVCPSPLAALDLLLHSKRLIATLRL